MYVSLRTKFQVSSIMLTSFRLRGGGGGGGGEGNFTPLPQNEHLKSPPRLGLKTTLGVAGLSGITSFKQLCFDDSSVVKTGMFHKTLNCLTFLLKLDEIALNQSIDQTGKVVRLFHLLLSPSSSQFLVVQ